MYLNLESAVIYGDVLIICLHLRTLRIPAISHGTDRPWRGSFSTQEFFLSFFFFYWDVLDILIVAKRNSYFERKLPDGISECLCVCTQSGDWIFLALCIQCVLTGKPRGGCVGKDLGLPIMVNRVALRLWNPSRVDPDVWLNSWHQL